MSISSSQALADRPAHPHPRRTTSRGDQSSEKNVNIDYSLYPPFIKQLDAKLPAYAREGDIEYPFEDTHGIGDENRIRGNWSNKYEYLLAAIGFTSGIGNLWRFPFLVFKYGGAAFLVPYFIVLLVAVLPIFFMELILGQFSSLAAITVWKVVPLFKGIGIAAVLLSSVCAIYFNLISGWSLFYLINSISFSLPWSNCANSWTGQNCTLGTRIACKEANGTLLLNGSCVVSFENANSTLVVNLPNQDAIPSLRFFHNDVLMLSDGFDQIGTLNWYLGICILIVWIAVFLCLFQGVKSSGKVVYAVVPLPFIILAVLLTRLLTLDGSMQALIHFSTPDWNVLKDPKVWGEAAVQAFYSLSCCTGGWITIASYNRFHNNVFKDMWLILFVDFLTSIVCCVLTFAAIGFTCYEFNIELDKFHISDGVHLVFVFLAEALAGVPVAPLYAALFFLMLLLSIHSTELFLVETMVSSICDEFPERLRRNRRHVLTTVCAIFIFISIPFCLSPGIYWLMLQAKFMLTWPLVAIGFLEIMAVSWVYGVDNLLDNVKWITGFYPPCYMLWKVLFKFICPLAYLAILCFLWEDWFDLHYSSYTFPYWTHVLGWTISVVPLIIVIFTGIWQICMAKGSFTRKWTSVLNPDDAWGPALAIHRAEHFPLQIPEARRLLLPPEVEVVSTPAPMEEDVPSESPFDRQGSIPGAPSRSVAATINTIPHYDRETAI